MKKLIYQEMIVCFHGRDIMGRITGDHAVWEFESDHPHFLQLFPSGTLLSFGLFDDVDPQNSYHVFACSVSKAIAKQLGEENY